MDSGIIDNGRDSPEPVRRERHLVVDAFPCKGVADDACAVSDRHHLEGRHLNVDVHLGAALGIGNGGEGDPKVLFLDTGHVGNYLLQLPPKVFVEVADGVVQLHCDLNKGGVVRGVPKLTPKVTVAVADIRRERCDTRALSRDVALSRCRRAVHAHHIVGAARLRTRGRLMHARQPPCAVVCLCKALVIMAP